MKKQSGYSFAGHLVNSIFYRISYALRHYRYTRLINLYMIDITYKIIKTNMLQVNIIFSVMNFQMLLGLT